jgi:GT2 family glycosyltransferase
VTPSGIAVDVVVVTWNTREVTLRALDQLAAGAAETSVHLVVHDNGSTDGTPAAIAARHPDCDIETSARNLGFAVGVNRALARTSAPYVLLLNSDAWPEPGAIDRLVACAERRPRAGAVAPKLLRPDGALEPSTWPFPTLRTAVSSALIPGRYVWPHDQERRVDWAVGAALLLRRTAIEAVGPFDESLFMYAEDLDWCWRASLSGWECWFTPDAVVRHVGNASGVQQYGERRSAAWINNSIRVHRKHRPWPATVSWRIANSAGALLAARRERRRGDREKTLAWRSQARSWLRPARVDGGEA